MDSQMVFILAWWIHLTSFMYTSTIQEDKEIYIRILCLGTVKWTKFTSYPHWGAAFLLRLRHTWVWILLSRWCFHLSFPQRAHRGQAWALPPQVVKWWGSRRVAFLFLPPTCIGNKWIHLNNDFISLVLCHVKHAQLCWTIQMNHTHTHTRMHTHTQAS